MVGNRSPGAKTPLRFGANTITVSPAPGISQQNVRAAAQSANTVENPEQIEQSGKARRVARDLYGGVRVRSNLTLPPRHFFDVRQD
jgi:uncharacterized protein (DUF2126 family)